MSRIKDLCFLATTIIEAVFLAFRWLCRRASFCLLAKGCMCGQGQVAPLMPLQPGVFTLGVYLGGGGQTQRQEAGGRGSRSELDACVQTCVNVHAFTEFGQHRTHVAQHMCMRQAECIYGKTSDFAGQSKVFIIWSPSHDACECV